MNHLFIFIEVMFPGVSCIDHRCSLQYHRCLGHQRPTVSSVVHRDRCWSRAMPPSSLGWRPAQISSGARDENGWIRFFYGGSRWGFLVMMWGYRGYLYFKPPIFWMDVWFLKGEKTNPKAELKMILQFNIPKSGGWDFWCNQSIGMGQKLQLFAALAQTPWRESKLVESMAGMEQNSQGHWTCVLTVGIEHLHLLSFMDRDFFCQPVNVSTTGKLKKSGTVAQNPAGFLHPNPSRRCLTSLLYSISWTLHFLVLSSWNRKAKLQEPPRPLMDGTMSTLESQISTAGLEHNASLRQKLEELLGQKSS